MRTTAPCAPRIPASTRFTLDKVAHPCVAPPGLVAGEGYRFPLLVFRLESFRLLVGRSWPSRVLWLPRLPA